jgi:hypothetical protein
MICRFLEGRDACIIHPCVLAFSSQADKEHGWTGF